MSRYWFSVRALLTHKSLIGFAVPSRHELSPGITCDISSEGERSRGMICRVFDLS